MFLKSKQGNMNDFISTHLLSLLVNTTEFQNRNALLHQSSTILTTVTNEKSLVHKKLYTLMNSKSQNN